MPEATSLVFFISICKDKVEDKAQRQIHAKVQEEQTQEKEIKNSKQSKEHHRESQHIPFC